MKATMLIICIYTNSFESKPEILYQRKGTKTEEIKHGPLICKVDDEAAQNGENLNNPYKNKK